MGHTEEANADRGRGLGEKRASGGERGRRSTELRLRLEGERLSQNKVHVRL